MRYLNNINRDIYYEEGSRGGYYTPPPPAKPKKILDKNTITRDNINYSDYKEKFEVKLDDKHVKLLDNYIEKLQDFYNELDEKMNFDIDVETRMLENMLKQDSNKK